MRIGELRHLVRLEERVEVADEAGGQSVNWVQVDEVWASIEPLSGREFLASQSPQSEVTNKVTIRYRDGVVAGMRIVHGDAVYGILYPMDIKGRHQLIQLMCTTGVKRV